MRAQSHHRPRRGAAPGRAARRPLIAEALDRLRSGGNAPAGALAAKGDPRMNVKDWLAYTVAVSLGLLAMILIVGLR